VKRRIPRFILAGLGSLLAGLACSYRPVVPAGASDVAKGRDAGTSRDAVDEVDTDTAAPDDDAGTMDAEDATTAPSQRDGAPAIMVADAGACPKGPGPRMVPVESGYCIDSTEVTNQQYVDFLNDPNKPAAAKLPAACQANNLQPGYPRLPPWTLDPTKLDFPINNVDWCDAYTYCKWAGKRLCGKIGGGSLRPDEVTSYAASQWMRACTANGRRAYPYEGSYDPGACDSGNPIDPVKLHAVGTRRSCEGGYQGLFDMGGNVVEWIDACEAKTCYLVGGSYVAQPVLETGCQRTPYPEVSTEKYDLAGFRCCSN
jgi:sulfatase modifying factor 1